MTFSQLNHRLCGALRVSVAAAACLSAGSCNIVSGVFVAVSGPEKIAGLYELDRSRPTVVLIDDFSSALPNRTVKRRIGIAAEQVLASDVKVKTVIRSEDLLTLIERQRWGAPMGIAEMGQAV